MLGLKFIHVSKRGPWWQAWLHYVSNIKIMSVPMLNKHDRWCIKYVYHMYMSIMLNACYMWTNITVLVKHQAETCWIFTLPNESCSHISTVYRKKYAHGFCFAVLCCGCTLTDFPISIRLTSLALWQSNDCPSAGKATLMNMDKYFMWIHYERLHNHKKTKHNKTVCIFLVINCSHQGPLCMD